MGAVTELGLAALSRHDITGLRRDHLSAVTSLPRVTMEEYCSVT
jgi:hypothetical protein